MKTPKTSRKALGTGSPTFSALLEALPHLVVMTDAHGGAHQLNARYGDHRVAEHFETKHRADTLFHTAVVLLDHVVEVLRFCRNKLALLA